LGRNGFERSASGFDTNKTNPFQSIFVYWGVRLEQDFGVSISCGYNFLSVIKENVSIYISSDNYYIFYEWNKMIWSLFNRDALEITQEIEKSPELFHRSGAIRKRVIYVTRSIPGLNRDQWYIIHVSCVR